MVQYALIVAGGKGLRMGTELPKQFLPIGGKPVLMRTLEAFYDYNAEIRIILVLPHSQQDYWRQLCRDTANSYRNSNASPYICAIGSMETILSPAFSGNTSKAKVVFDQRLR